MSRDYDVRQWLTPVDRTVLRDIDVDLLDASDPDERSLLVRAQHPEYARAIDREADTIVEAGQEMNPRLHLTMHEVVLNQLADDDPPEVRRTAERLLREGYDRHEIVHMIAAGVSSQLWSAMREHQPYDADRYIAFLDGLPDSWHDDFGGADDVPEPDDGWRSTETEPEADEPELGAHVDDDADELLDAVGEWPTDAFEAEIAAWASERPTAAEELADAARRTERPDVRALAFAALGIIGDQAEPVVRALRSDPRLRPFAALWLVDRGLEPPDTLDADDVPSAVIQTLAILLIQGGPDEIEAAVRAGDQLDPALVDELWRVNDPWTESVLEALGAASDKKIAKSARRSLFKYRNRN